MQEENEGGTDSREPGDTTLNRHRRDTVSRWGRGEDGRPTFGKCLSPSKMDSTGATAVNVSTEGKMTTNAANRRGEALRATQIKASRRDIGGHATLEVAQQRKDGLRHCTGHRAVMERSHRVPDDTDQLLNIRINDFLVIPILDSKS